MICVVALVAVGPKKLPGMLNTLGQWLRKIRNLTNDVRSQTGIDDLLRSEGLHGGLNELRGLLRGNHGLPFEPPRAPVAAPPPAAEDPYAHLDLDSSREYPPEGADAYGALPDDLLDEGPAAAVVPVASVVAASPVVPDGPVAPDAPSTPTEGA